MATTEQISFSSKQYFQKGLRSGIRVVVKQCKKMNTGYIVFKFCRRRRITSLDYHRPARQIEMSVLFQKYRDKFIFGESFTGIELM